MDWRAEVERCVRDAAQEGRPCDLSVRPPGERVVSADLLYELCTGERHIHASGLDLLHAQIDDPLDFTEATLTVPMVLRSCTLAADLSLVYATSRSILLRDCITKTVNVFGLKVSGQLLMSGGQIVGTDGAGNALFGERLQVDGDVFLDDGFRSAGAVHLSAARISGRLVMSAAQVMGTDGGGNAVVAERLQVENDVLFDRLHAAGAVRLRGAAIAGQLAMSGAVLEGTDTRGNALAAEQLDVGDCVYLDEGFRAAGALRLSGARVAGQLVMSGAQLDGTDEHGNALVADRIQVDDSAYFDNGFRAAGAMRLPGANVESQLVMSGAIVDGTDTEGNALFAERLDVGDTAFFDEGFRAAGALRLASARIAGQLNMAGATLDGTGTDETALGADHAVLGSALLSDGFRAAGEVRLPGAKIESQLVMSGAQLDGVSPDGHALFAERLQVGNGALLDNGFRAAGVVYLSGATIPQLTLSGAAADGGSIVLENATLGSFRPGLEGPTLGLTGIRFDTITGVQTSKDQLQWIQRQGWRLWSPDPYEQLASAYERRGDEEGARHIRVSCASDELRHLREAPRSVAPGARLAAWRYRFWRSLLGVLVGFGYKRYRAGWALTAMIIAAMIMFGWGEREGAMVPSEPENRRAACGEAFPCFNAAVYGMDVVLPIIDFGQDSAWRPVEIETSDRVLGHSVGNLWVASRWFFIAFGWILASVFVAAFTSLLQKR